MKDLLQLAYDLIPVVKAAGEVEMKYYNATGIVVTDKADGSPVTLADQEAEKLIIDWLKKLAPGIPAVGEESTAAGIIPDISSGTFILVDSLDGTREFIGHNGEFTVNIAVVEKGVPVMGIIYSPVSGTLYIAAEGQAFDMSSGTPEKMHVRDIPEAGLTVLAGKRPGDAEKIKEFLKDKKVKDTASCSSSFKFCAIAAGKADIYPRLGPTCEWDTAAGDAILRAAGGSVKTLDGQPLVYGKKDKKFLNPNFVASGP